MMQPSAMSGEVAKPNSCAHSDEPEGLSYRAPHYKIKSRHRRRWAVAYFCPEHRSNDHVASLLELPV